MKSTLEKHGSSYLPAKRSSCHHSRESCSLEEVKSAHHHFWKWVTSLCYLLLPTPSGLLCWWRDSTVKGTTIFSVVFHHLLWSLPQKFESLFIIFASCHQPPHCSNIIQCHCTFRTLNFNWKSWACSQCVPGSLFRPHEKKPGDEAKAAATKCFYR